MRQSPLNLRKGDHILHLPSRTVGTIVKRQDPFLLVQTKDGKQVQLADFPVDYCKLTKREYQAYGLD